MTAPSQHELAAPSAVTSIAACSWWPVPLVVRLRRLGWTAELAGAVIASGVVVVDSDVKKVQHPTGRHGRRA